MSDPLTVQERFNARGLSYALTKQGRTVTFNGKTLTGVRTELEIDPKDLTAGGFKSTSRAWSILIPKTQFVAHSAAVPASGTTITDDTGEKFKIARTSVDAIQVMIYADNLNR